MWGRASSIGGSRSRPWLGLVALGLLFGCGGGGRGCAGPEPESGATRPDLACLALLRKVGIAFTTQPAVRGIRTPVVIKSAIQGVKLVPRGRREALMDCALARALYEAGPVLRGLEIDAMEYSAAYDYRSRRDSPALSAHARGLAIDVHAVHSRSRRYQVATDYEKGVGQWVRLRPGPGALAGCIGKPATEAGKLLRTLACRLKLGTSFQILVTPDDNADHRDHLHLEVYPDVAEADPPS
jgi:hypothetical protein